MIRKVQTYIEKNLLLTTYDKPVIVGFSGGCDSVSLLYILNRLGYNCIAAHCNFHLRGEESDRDEHFSKDFAQTKNIKFEKIDFNTSEYASENGLSIEMAARELRYDWFEHIRQKYNAQAIAIAHHQDDSIETMLLNIMRGSGIRGLCGIRQKNGYIIRPLLCVNREDILQFAKKQNLKYVTDSTNLSDKYTRNFIRLRMLPLMENVNPSVRTALARTAENISEAEVIYLKTIEQAQESLIETNENGETEIQINELMKFPASKTILYELLKPYGFSRLVAEDAFYAASSESGKMFKAQETQYRLLKDHNKFIIFIPQNKLDDSYTIEEKDLQNPTIPINLKFQTQTIDASFAIDKSAATATLDYDKIHFPLTIRRWKEGDFFYPFGMKGKKKLSDYFNDHKFSILKKKQIWLLCEGDNIIWIVGERTDNRYRIDSKTKTALIINFLKKKYDIFL